MGGEDELSVARLLGPTPPPEKTHERGMFENCSRGDTVCLYKDHKSIVFLREREENSFQLEHVVGL